MRGEAGVAGETLSRLVDLTGRATGGRLSAEEAKTGSRWSGLTCVGARPRSALDEWTRGTPGRCCFVA